MTLCLCGQSISRNQSKRFSQLHGLGSAPGAQLVEQAAGMGLDGVFAHKEFFGDLAIAQAVGNPCRLLLESYKLRQRKDAKDLATKLTDHLSV